MSDCIFQLPDAVASQIAAGEVVQRPASVLKELVENAIDARSTSVRIYLKDAGKTQIQVIDDGVGMSPTDASRAFLRHATSKIKEAADLYSIHSLGFRGEALPSIASVAEVVVRTRRAGDETGTEVRMAGSELVHQEPVVCACGSDFSVKNLFYNIPVRRKFLKSDTTELNHCLTEFRRVALTYPQIAFSLFHNKAELFHLSAGTRIQRITQIFGQAMQKQLLHVEISTPLAQVSGYVAKPEMARKSAGEQYFFANGRFIRHAMLHKAVVQAFSQLIPADCIPVYFIWIEVPADAIDINIHPTKVDVRFEQDKALCQIVSSAVKEALGKFNILPPIDFETENIMDEAMGPSPVRLRETAQVTSAQPASPTGGRSWGKGTTDTRISLPWEQLQDAFEAAAASATAIPSAEAELPELPGMQPVAADSGEAMPEMQVLAVKDRFAVTSVRQGLMFVDTRRAFERLEYEYFLHAWRNGASKSQQCMFPESVELSSDDYDLCCTLKDDLSVMGFDLEYRPDVREVTLNGQPADLTPDCNAARLLESLLDEFRTLEDSDAGSVEKLARCFARLLSLSHVQPESSAASQHLVEQLLTCASPSVTPSGQKIIHILPFEEIAHWFNIICP